MIFQTLHIREFFPSNLYFCSFHQFHSLKTVFLLMGVGIAVFPDINKYDLVCFLYYENLTRPLTTDIVKSNIENIPQEGFSISNFMF
jgi:hypothetical protein